jgi:hypothetical protein
MAGLMHSPYYKERRQLKTFLTQIGPALPLTLDPPVRLRDDQKRWNDHKNRNLGSISAKKANCFLTNRRSTHLLYPQSLYLYFSS